MKTLTPETGYFTVTSTGKRHHAKDFETAAYDAYHLNREKVIEVFKVNVNGQIETRERNCTIAAIDFLSSLEH